MKCLNCGRHESQDELDRASPRPNPRFVFEAELRLCSQVKMQSGCDVVQQRIGAGRGRQARAERRAHGRSHCAVWRDLKVGDRIQIDYVLVP